MHLVGHDHEAAADDLEWLGELAREWPLVLWSPWHTENTSQRLALETLGTFATFFFGGNRSGKTALLKVLCVAYALGRDHPMVKVWGELNGLNLESMGVPLGPGKVFLMAKSSTDSIRYHRGDIDRLLPRRGKRWRNRDGRGEAVVEAHVAGYDGKAEIWFKSEDQGREGMQGDSIRAAFVDEEVSEGVWNELLLRLADQAGQIFCSMTPLKGLTWVYHRYSGQPQPAEEGSVAHWLTATDNPYVPQAFLRKLYQGMTTAEQEAREKGNFIALEGRVYPMWARGVHMCAWFDIPANWPRFRALDIGARHRTCVLWGAIGEDGCLYLYREIWTAGLTTNALAAAIKDLEDGEPIENSWADPSSKQTLRDLRREHSERFRPAIRDWKRGRSAVIDRLNLELDNEPRLKVLRRPDGRPTCPGLVVEIENYTDPRTDTQSDSPPPRPGTGDDAMDTLRYLCIHTARY